MPFGRYFGLHVRAISVIGDPGTGFQWNVGGRVELFGQTPVFLDRMRFYGAGGVQAFYPVRGSAAPVLLWGGAGEFGFEFFLTRRAAFFIEIGGSGANPLVSGGTALAGINVYPF